MNIEQALLGTVVVSAGVYLADKMGYLTKHLRHLSLWQLSRNGDRPITVAPNQTIMILDDLVGAAVVPPVGRSKMEQIKLLIIAAGAVVMNDPTGTVTMDEAIDAIGGDPDLNIEPAVVENTHIAYRKTRERVEARNRLTPRNDA